jgi:hypothetical protein
MLTEKKQVKHENEIYSFMKENMPTEPSKAIGIIKALKKTLISLER